MTKKNKILSIVLFVLLIGFTMLGAACENGTKSDLSAGSSKSPFDGKWDVGIANCYFEIRGNELTDYEFGQIANTGIFEYSGDNVQGTYIIKWDPKPGYNSNGVSGTYNFISPNELLLNNSRTWTRISD